MSIGLTWIQYNYNIVMFKSILRIQESCQEKKPARIPSDVFWNLLILFDYVFI